MIELQKMDIATRNNSKVTRDSHFHGR